ncbi:hypothetical protein KQH82_04275 [bacterium]|nr:hypothetical protein [bacterium]
MKTKALIWSGVLALLALLTISAVSTDATGDPESAADTIQAADECPMHSQKDASSETQPGSGSEQDMLRLLQACEDEVDLILSSNNMGEMTERLNQFRQNLTYTRQSLLQPKSMGGCCGDPNPSAMSSRDPHEGCSAAEEANSSNK